MEQINKIELNDENIYPDDTLLSKVLDKSFHSYLSLLKMIEEHGMTYEWKYYKDGKAWLCKVQKKSKTIIWMSAWKGYIKATIYFPERYLSTIINLPISEEMKQAIINTKNVGKSKPCMFDIREDSILKDLEAVMMYKDSLK